jgi:hypothetical protein
LYDLHATISSGGSRFYFIYLSYYQVIIT